jgi:hypothetical protein
MKTSWRNPALGRRLIAVFMACTVSMHVQAKTCPCDYAGSVDAVSLEGAEMRCASTNLGFDGIPPDGLRNQFIASLLDENDAVEKTVRMGLYEQGMLPGVVMSPTCFVQEVSDKRPRTRAAEYIMSVEDYTACARELTAFVSANIAQASNRGDTSCIDTGGIRGVMDVWETGSGLSPQLPPRCLDETNREIPCP